VRRLIIIIIIMDLYYQGYKKKIIIIIIIRRRRKKKKICSAMHRRHTRPRNWILFVVKVNRTIYTVKLPPKNDFVIFVRVLDLDLIVL